MTAQDIKPRMDITGLTTVSATEMQQITSTATPADDKGFLIITQDGAANVPIVPNPAIEIEGITPKYWERYVWIRKPFSGVANSRNILYSWNPNRVNNVKLLKWEPIDELISQAITGSDEALKKANEALSKANEALATSEITEADLDEVRVDIVSINEAISSIEATNKSLLSKQPAIGIDNASDKYVYRLKLDPEQTELINNQVVRFIAPTTCDHWPQLQIQNTAGANIAGLRYLSRHGGSGNIQNLSTGDIVKGQYIEAIYSSVTNTWNVMNPITYDGVFSAQNVTIRNNPGALNTHLFIKADSAVLTNNTAFGVRVRNGIDLQCTQVLEGLNGIDVMATKTNSTWYYIWLIFNPEASTIGALLSKANADPIEPRPKMPVGFTHKALVGQVYIDAIGNFNYFYQRNRNVWFNKVQIFTAKGVGVANTYQNLTPAELAILQALIPPSAVSVSGNIGKIAGITEGMYVALAADINGLGEQSFHMLQSVDGNDWSVACAFSNLLVGAPQQLYWKNVNTNATNRLEITGYTF